MSRRTKFVSVNLTPAARDELRRAALELSAPAGRYLSMSDVLAAAVRVAMRHQGDLLDAITGAGEEGVT